MLINANFALQVEIYPLKIHLTETMYRMMWGYLFPEEEQDSQRRQVGRKIDLNFSTVPRNSNGKELIINAKINWLFPLWHAGSLEDLNNYWC